MGRKSRASPVMATVFQIVPQGKHGPYAVAELKGGKMKGEKVTFSLEPNSDPRVWKEDEWPENGNIVLVDDLRLKSAGWRAHKARFCRPEDMQNRKQVFQGNKQRAVSSIREGGYHN